MAKPKKRPKRKPPARAGAVAAKPKGTGKAGRPHELNATIAEELCKAVTIAGFLSTAAKYCGIPWSTVSGWYARGKGQDPGRPAVEPYVAFAHAVDKAKASAQMNALVRIRQAGQGGQVVERNHTIRKDGTPTTTERFAKPEWTADAWFLERSDPEKWGRRRLELSGPGGGPIPIRSEIVQVLQIAVGVIRKYLPAEQARQAVVEIGQLTDASLRTPQNNDEAQSNPLTAEAAAS